MGFVCFVKARWTSIYGVMEKKRQLFCFCTLGFGGCWVRGFSPLSLSFLSFLLLGLLGWAIFIIPTVAFTP